MKTEIQTKDILKLVNPSKDGVFYQDQKIVIDLKELKKYVEQPKQNQVFTASGDVATDLYKNLALYIINAEESPKLIHIDLNTPHIFEPGHGLFEYVKNLYNKEEKSYINIEENGDNLLLIKSKKLEPLNNSATFAKAEDIHSVTPSLFSDTAKVDIAKLNQVNGQFTWKEEDVDRYSNLDFVVGKVNEIFKVDKYKSNRNSDSNVEPHKEFFKLIQICNKDLINSDSFKLALMDIDSDSLRDFLTSRHEKNDSDAFSINFSEPIFQAKILEKVKKKEFRLLEKIFEKYLTEVKEINYKEHWSKKNPEKTIPQPIDFSLFLNEPETIEHLIGKYHSSSYFRSDDDKFSVVSCYQFLSEDNKRDAKIVNKYLSQIISKSDSVTHLDDRLFYKLPPDVMNRPEVISQVVSSIRFNDFKNFLKTNNIECPNFFSKETILSHSTKLYSYRVTEWITNFIPKNEIDKDFIHSLIKVDPQFYNELTKLHSFEKYANDWDIITTAVRGGYDLKKIDSSIMKPLLLKDGSPEQEEIKIRYLIEKKSITEMNYLFDKPEYLQKAKEKYHKPEYMFYKVDTWFSEYAAATRSLSKIKSSEEVLKVLDTIDNSNFGYEFNSDFFYRSLNPSLKKNKQIYSRILSLGPIRYNSLDEQLAYNSDIVIDCLKRNPKDVTRIPLELFNNSKFAVKFAQMMDGHYFEKTDIPNFVTKFFDNQGVTERFEDYLKTYISYKEIQQKFDVEKPLPEVTKPKRNKI